jgi:voltage-gated potassium channel
MIDADPVTKRDTQAEHVTARFRLPVLIAALLTLPATIIEEAHRNPPWPAIATAFNWAIWLVFLAELVAVLLVARSRKRWLRTHPLELVIVALTPPALFTLAQPVRLLRLVQLVRMAPLIKVLLTREGLRYAAALALLTAVAGGAAFASAEKQSIANGIYWAITTMTTVGYGDITPKTPEGKLVAVFVMLVGIGTATLVIGTIAQRFVHADVTETIEETEDENDDVIFLVRDISQRLSRLESALTRKTHAS